MTLKGAVVAPMASAADVKALLDAGASLVRYQLPIAGYTPVKDEVLNLFRVNQRIILDLHFYPEDSRELINYWKGVIPFYAGNHKVIFGIANEPSFPKYNYTAKEVIKYSYRRAKLNSLAVTCPYSDPLQFSKTVYYPNRPIYYEVHMYLPFKFTHQGVYPQYPVGEKYPTVTLNKAKLKAYLKKVREFQLKYKAPILVGEFSCSIYADPDSRFNYLKDCIDIFNEYGWHWCYHAWREAAVWDIEGDKRIFDMMKEEWSK